MRDAIGRRHAVPPRLTFSPSSLMGARQRWCGGLQDAPANGMTRVEMFAADARTLSCVLPLGWLGLVVVVARWWFARALFWPLAGSQGMPGGGWMDDGRPVPADADYHTLLRPTPGRVWFRGGETGGQAVALPMMLWWWWWWLVVGVLGLKDEAPLQSRSEHGTRKRNVSSRLPANRRRCNPPFVSPESTRESGSHRLLVLFVVVVVVDGSGVFNVCFSSGASIARAEKAGTGGRRKMGRVVCARGSLPPPSAFAAPHSPLAQLRGQAA
ncbi:hypothetical protein B0T18DRAFT_160199 [Schizothecium vesticola]|uniref:Uncharacterized protein n=1 Tax=Schizothecium vesticola TaxID=314040 RepID=A0AA40EWF8_9PEZI|nr:hypothetical protein B0T18DRAFT_160199 [Schizothecium vesticola]